MWQRMWVRILDLSPMLQILMQSSRLCSDAAGDVSSMYSTPKSDSAWAIRHLVSVSKKAFAAKVSPGPIRQREGPTELLPLPQRRLDNLPVGRLARQPSPAVFSRTLLRKSA